MSAANEEGKNSSLAVHEWLAVALIIGMIIGLTCLTAFQNSKEVKSHSTYILKENPGFDVLIKGAVDNPGIYRLPHEMKLQDLLVLAGVSFHADLRRFQANTLIKKARTLNVPARAMITVYLKGAVKEEQTLLLPKGSKVEDLIPLANLSENASIETLRKKRRLKDRETIQIKESTKD